MNCLMIKYHKKLIFDKELKEDVDYVGKLIFDMDNDNEPKRKHLIQCNEIWKRNKCKKDEIKSVEPLYLKVEIPKE